MAGKGARYFMVRRKRDANHAAICKALEAAGADVWDLSGCKDGIPDAAVLKPSGGVVFMEIKTAKGTMREKQIEAAKRWPVVTVRTIDEALEAIR